MNDPDSAELFWSRVDRSGDCWLWLGRRTKGGYGDVGWTLPGERSARAHRLAWALTFGPIPKDPWGYAMCVLHHCDNPPCVRPDHLFLGTTQDNTADMVAKGRQFAARRLMASRACP